MLVGAGAKILGPITIGSDARVGANSVVVQDVPEGGTVVGIPGRIVVSKAVTSGEQGINLNHHLIPDPVGRAIACLLERIDKLEARLEEQGEIEPDYRVNFYNNCSPASEICEKDCAGGKQTFS